jgi:DNA-binding transcriptional regulator YiaG
MAETSSAWDADGVRALRERLGMTQRQLADELGVRQQTVSEWETGMYRPRGASARMLRHVAERAATYDAAMGNGQSAMGSRGADARGGSEG